MIDFLKRMVTIPSRTRQDEEDREKMATLERAERDLDELKVRKDRAVAFLSTRDDRNHWQESVANMIRGVS